MLLVCYHFKIEQFLKGYIFIILIINILYLKHIINFPIHSFLLFSYNFITKKNPHIYIYILNNIHSSYIYIINS